MILKQLDLVGFKSFVDATRMEFTNGFTAVVGPNGCGKSNISDAIRWVIGEQSAKMLRGSKITDLIFNGSSDRKPVNRTEISLTLGDVPPGLRIANVPNISEEIKITRSYNRSGESEFFINNIPCRLKDITDLLLDVGISPKVLTVIEQNHIQDIVTSKPEDRRIWIEEAAGILKFKHRRNEALRKLEASGQNLDRISDIVQELERQKTSLKRQAAKAERYKEFHSRIKELSLNLFSKKIRRAQMDLSAVEKDLAGQTDRKTQLTAKSSTLENQIVTRKTELDKLFSGQNAKRESLHELSNQIRQKEHNIELKGSQMEQARQDIQSAVQEAAQMNLEIASIDAEIESQRSELGNVSNEINAQESAAAENGESLDQLRRRSQEMEDNVQRGELEAQEIFQRISRLKSDLASLETRRQFLNDQETKLDHEGMELRQQLESGQANLSKAEISFERNAQTCDSLKQELEEIRREISQAREHFEEQEANLQTVKDACLSRSALLNSFRELRKKFEGYGSGVKSLFGDTNGDRITGLRDVLADVLKAPPEYEKAIEAVMGEKLQSVIVNSYSDGLAAISYLNEHKSGRGSFIPLQMKSIPQPPLDLNGSQGINGKAIDLVQTSEEYRPILELLLGSVVITEDLDTAVRLHETEGFFGTAATLNGEVIDAQGLVSGGMERENSSGLLAQNRKMEDLDREVESLRQKLEIEKSKSVRMKEALVELETKHSEIQSATHESEINRNNSQKDLENLQSEVKRLKERKNSIGAQRESGSRERQDLGQQNTSLKEEHSRTEEDKIQAEQALAERRNQLKDHRKNIDEKLEEFNRVKVLMASLKGKRENILSEIKRSGLQQENLRHRIAQRENERLENSGKIAEYEKVIKNLEKQILESAGEEDRLKENLKNLEATLEEKEESLDQIEKESRELFKRVQDIMEEISRIELKQSELKIQVSHIEEKAFEDFNVSRDELLRTYTGEVDERETADELAAFKEKISKLGEVNLAALSEFTQVNERYEFLAKQQEDLAESILTLHETIDKINLTTHKLFLETFDQVNKHFSELFGRLFGGGKAEMSLCDPDNPLESGVDISASPLGKKMLHLSLLSGGEKAMTAIAMVFAIFKVRPSPFCLLDEVDAPLDDANVIRFQEILKEMSNETQFIMITHNQRTMSFADTLYGVTMEERGVSKVVSVHLN